MSSKTSELAEGAKEDPRLAEKGPTARHVLVHLRRTHLPPDLRIRLPRTTDSIRGAVSSGSKTWQGLREQAC